MSKTYDLLKQYGPVVARAHGSRGWKVEWMLPGVTVRPPTGRNLLLGFDRAMKKGKKRIYTIDCRPQNFFVAVLSRKLWEDWCGNTPRYPYECLARVSKDWWKEYHAYQKRLSKWDGRGPKPGCPWYPKETEDENEDKAS